MIILPNLPLPPTTNHAYETFRTPGKGGGKMVMRKRLSDKGRSYKTDVHHRILQSCPQHTLRPSRPYELCIVLRLPLYTNKTGELRKLDASNRIKLLEDALCEGLGIDDSQFITIHVAKRDAEHESTDVMIWDPSCRRQTAAVLEVLNDGRDVQSLHGLQP